MGSSDKFSPDVAGVGKGYSPLNRIVVFFVALIFLSLVGLLLLYGLLGLEKDSFGREVGVVLLQLTAAGVIGVIVTLLLKQYLAWQQQLQAAREKQAEENRRAQEWDRAEQWQQERAERQRADQARDLQRIVLENKNVIKKNIIKRLGQIYNDVKAARRTLRSKVLSLPYNDKNVSIANIYMKPYAQYMEVINDLQLDLESITEEVRSGIAEVALFNNPDAIYNGLKAMENYLRSVFREYEASKDKFNDRAYAAYIEFPQLADLLGSAREENPSGFRGEFLDQYKTVMADMLRELVHP